MSRAMPPLTWFRAFEAAARHLNFTAAADELGLTQSAISQHVRSLELRFGVVLFDRKPRGLALTDEGRRLVPDVSQALNTLAAVSRDFDQRPEGPSLTIASSISVAQWYLAPGIADFQKQHPNLPVRIINTTWPDEFRLPIADVEIRFGSERLVGKDAERLTPNRTIIVASPAIGKGVTNLEDYPLIAPVGTSDTWRHWADSIGHDGNIEPSLLVDSHGMAVELAVAGAGLALTSSLIAAPALGDRRLMQLDLPSADSIDGYFLAVNDDNSGIAEAFADWLRDRIRAVREQAVP